MKLRKTLCCFLAIIFVFGTFCNSANAAGVVPVPSGLYIIDNDALASSGYWNGGTGFSKYIEDSSLYNQDARVASASEGGSYEYNHNKIYVGTKFYANVGVYLNNITFEDPAAEYYCWVNGRAISFATINQNTAPAGWNYRTFPTQTREYNSYMDGVQVVSSKRKATGADAISIQYWAY